MGKDNTSELPKMWGFQIISNFEMTSSCFEVELFGFEAAKKIEATFCEFKNVL